MFVSVWIRGLTNQRHNRVKMSFTEKQLRSRCWWAIYGLERYAFRLVST